MFISATNGCSSTPPPTTWLLVQEAICAAAVVVIPVRPGFFDLAAVRETVSTAREANKPYAVVIRTLVQPPSVNKIAGARSASARWASPAMALSAAL
jgi:chromosome partitioning protein